MEAQKSNPQTKYLIFSKSIFIETISKPGPEDIIVSSLNASQGSSKHLTGIKDGVSILKMLNSLVNEHNYGIALHSRGSKKEQIDFIKGLELGAQDKGTSFPKIAAVPIEDSTNFKDVQPTNPAILKDEETGITIAAFNNDKSFPGKSGVREALSKALGISSSDRSRHIIIDEAQTVIDKANEEGWTTIQPKIGKTLKDIITEIYEKEITPKISLFFIEPDVTVDQGNENIPALKFLRTFADFSRKDSANIALLKGESGIGKTHLLQCFEQLLKKDHNEALAPMFVDLKDHSNQDLDKIFQEALKSYKIPETKRIVLLVDGYDHSERMHHKNDIQALERYHSNLKVIISFRSEQLFSNYHRWFTPTGWKLQEVEIQPLNSDQINRFVSKKLGNDQASKAKQYQNALNASTDVKRLMAYPGQLEAALEVFSTFKNLEQLSEADCYVIYRSAMESWLQRQEKSMSQEKRGAFESLWNSLLQIALGYLTNKELSTEKRISKLWLQVSMVPTISDCPLAKLEDHKYLYEFFIAEGVLNSSELTSGKQSDIVSFLSCILETIDREPGILNFLRNATSSRTKAQTNFLKMMELVTNIKSQISDNNPSKNAYMEEEKKEDSQPRAENGVPAYVRGNTKKEEIAYYDESDLTDNEGPIDLEIVELDADFLSD